MNSSASQSSSSGCDGRLAHLAEVARRADDALAEVVLPEAIDHHARGERVVLRRRATRRARAGASSTSRPRAAARERPLRLAHDREHAGRHLRSRRVRTAAMQEERRLRHRGRARRSRSAVGSGRGVCLSSAAISRLHVARASPSRPAGISATMSASVTSLRSRIVGRDACASICVTLSFWPVACAAPAASSTRPACTRAASRSRGRRSSADTALSICVFVVAQRPLQRVDALRLRRGCASTSSAGASG